MTDAAALRADFDALSRIGRDPEGGWSRPAYSEAECEAHRWFAEAARAAGMTVRQDAFGNSIARREGRAGAAAVAIGSHLDTVSRGGLYDGALGVLAGLEVVRRIAPAPDLRPVEVIAFRDEEGRFGAFTGSRAMTGDLPADALRKARDTDGVMLSEAMAQAGLTPASADAARRDMAEIAAYLELHIEQGPVLEAAGQSIGIATAIAGQERLSLRFTGEAGHAGTTPMEMRRDAFAAASAFAVAFRDLILAEGEGSARGTIGIVKISPNQGNVIPSEVRLGLEIRDASLALISRLAARTAEVAEDAGRRFGVEVVHRRVYAADPVPMAPHLMEMFDRAAAGAGYSAPRLLSGANHDAGVIGAHVPAALLFVPSRGGVSHTPDEHTDWHHILAGVAVLEGAARQPLATQS